MVGNAVCPPVIAALAGAIMAHLGETGAAGDPVKEREWRELRGVGIRAAVGLARCALPVPVPTSSDASTTSP